MVIVYLYQLFNFTLLDIYLPNYSSCIMKPIRHAAFLKTTVEASHQTSILCYP